MSSLNQTSINWEKMSAALTVEVGLVRKQTDWNQNVEVIINCTCKTEHNILKWIYCIKSNIIARYLAFFLAQIVDLRSTAEWKLVTKVLQSDAIES